jgi:hypothetical protein
MLCYQNRNGSTKVITSKRGGLSSYELNRQRNNRINGCNCRGIAVMCVQCILRTDDNAK